MRTQQYLDTYSDEFPTVAEAAAEAVRVMERLALPRETELFMSDIHGEHAAFSQVLRDGCGVLTSALREELEATLPEERLRELATLLRYPDQKLPLLMGSASDMTTLFAELSRLLAPVLRRVAARHMREDVLASTPTALCTDIALVLDGREQELQPSEELVIGMCRLMQALAVDRLHLVGDVYDRGPFAERIMDELENYHAVDIQWGNHDIVWMGAAAGQPGCIAHVVRNCARYGNLSILTEAYGIDLAPLVDFANEAYADDPCAGFALKSAAGLNAAQEAECVRVQKAMAIIQFKVEAQLIDENPSFDLADRKLMDAIDFDAMTVVVDGVEYPLADTVFPTVDPSCPNRLTAGEKDVVCKLQEAFRGCELLQRHMAVFLKKGSLYKIHNGALMYHACVPLNADGTLKEVNIYGQVLKGRALFDAVDAYVRAAFGEDDPQKRKRGLDLLWYLWLGEGSPLFAKSKMATFEIYLIADKAARKEVKNPYYALLEDDVVVDGIFEDFGMDPKTSHIVSGHVPVKVKDGEDPVKCGGRVFIIDGGFSAAYQKTTGIAGLTLVSDEEGIQLVSHQALLSTEAAVKQDLDLQSKSRVVWQAPHKLTMASTDRGPELEHRLAALEELVLSYKTGERVERRTV